MQFECGCGAVVSVCEPGIESELNVQATCECCGSKYAVTITPFTKNYETELEAVSD